MDMIDAPDVIVRSFRRIGRIIYSQYQVDNRQRAEGDEARGFQPLHGALLKAYGNRESSLTAFVPASNIYLTFCGAGSRFAVDYWRNQQ